MRLAILAVIATGCAPHTGAAAPTPATQVATRWVPDRPSYVLASQALDRAQGSLLEAIDLLGTLGGIESREVAQRVADVIHVDALHPDAVAAIGIDPRGGWAMFSESVNPTLVVRLAAPDLLAAFLDREREHGLVTQSVIVDDPGSPRGKAEVWSASLGGGRHLSWAVAGEWMWIHLALPGVPEQGPGWFAASRAPHTGTWTADWAWAQRAAGAAAGVVGWFDLRGAIAGAVARLPDGVACAQLVAPIGRAAVSIDGDERHVAARFTLDVGSTERLRSWLLPPPGGWAATAAGAAIAAQWNLDVPAVRAWLAPCLATAGVELGAITETGVRAARGLLLEFNPEGPTAAGALALDLTRAAYFERQLDQIPLRRALERPRTFAGTRGVSLAIPFAATVDYVLDDHRALAAVGDGVLARVLAPGAAAAPPIFALDVAPPAMAPRAWVGLLGTVVSQLAGGSGLQVERIVDRMMRWRSAHLAATAERGELVITATGERR